ncbi:CRISPR-associated protein Cas4 [Shimazuella alba]|uniref:CRISPR-associated exonuclease Cas4 n=1 Tax=Shimazuella alba TaxID=2690964 RepID=A0A6I4VXU7_9BACL|nr:CRISPR-associated protein Cas4 [Shimazuella alba]MXQ54795.1 CRISPR-associated protein Cas4 [Shimazuella alba]
MGYSEEDEYLWLSGIQHFQFCQRQWALIYLEDQWAENDRTIEGQYLHRNADQPLIREKRGNKLIVRGMRIRSHELKFTGICDVVEFVRDDNGVKLSGEEGTYIAYPVEYKRGKPKKEDEDILQLAAQAICLEEMLLCEVPIAYLFYDSIKRRVEIPLTDTIKNKVRAIAQRMHQYYQRKHTPKVKTGSFCKKCSLQHVCLPELLRKQSVKSYIEGKIAE